MTRNPTIFAKTICGSDRYDEQLAALRSAGVELEREGVDGFRHSYDEVLDCIGAHG